ncbi:protein DpdJ [Peribacillus frigoritolerans]|uniref:protein DpdJ n=1 Tax=Peribacillus frigoritolerans TaxID=450367 RepID=UPI003399B664
MYHQEYIRDFLGYIEEIESTFLSWGYVEIGFSEKELEDLAEKWIEEQQADIDSDDLINGLFEKQMIQEFQTGSGTESLFRSRMTETVRLLARLRQLFPSKDNDWRTGATLVSDFRFSLRPRTYPRRDQPAEEIMKSLRATTKATGEELQILSALLNRGIKNFQLANFQVRAIEQMFKDFNTKRDKGFIVCAGTGTGKTLSFYLPALTKIAMEVEDNEYWTKALALYPRNELLKDQFLETYEEARLLDEWMLEHAGRKLKIGAFFGPTPQDANKDYINWDYNKSKQGYDCPYMKCPDCGSSLYWYDRDLQAKRERLTCGNRSCLKEINSDEVMLTRSSMEEHPPDIVFTSTEMMNRMLGNLQSCKVIGVGVERAPFMMLLDEVHTYEGIHGAQVSYLLRRWRNALAGTRKIHYTGLSATLEDAGAFFAQLVGLYESQVTIIEPKSEEMIPEGKEYQLILRGDPVAGTSLLSTTIQTVMLMRRMLDMEDNFPSDGMVGERVFVFTDDLDVTNRLYHNILDAEGYDNNGRPQFKNGYPLASLRSSAHQDQRDQIERLRAGQHWQSSERIGHHLDERLRIGRTSSQDAGVGSDLDVVVATASLEVGYNDPKVGAVIQHKAPMDLSSFLQRKGRAGRKRDMRPWTITILSDYGRDRFVYQTYEQLFNPLLNKRTLPVRNRYVIRMQAVFCLIDWLTNEIRGKQFSKYGNLWSDLAENSSKEWTKKRQGFVVHLLKKVISEERYRDRLVTYMKKALQISDEEIAEIFWEPPRSIMMAVIPTLLRRLESEWHLYHPTKRNKKEIVVGNGNVPLSEFIPSNLFSDLSLPEVYVDIGTQQAEAMRIVQALSAFAPGRVTRRFGIQSRNDSHWIVPTNLDLSNGHQVLSLNDFCKKTEELGYFTYMEDGEEKRILCMRPYFLQPQLIPEDIYPTSNARLTWKSELFPSKQVDRSEKINGMSLDIPSGTSWAELLTDIQLFSHNIRNPVIIRRFAISSTATIKRKVDKQAEEYEKTFTFVNEDGEEVALGFAQESDGIVFRYAMPDVDLVGALDKNVQKLQAFRTSYFRHLILTDNRLDELMNDFERDRFAEIYLSILTSIALKDSISLKEAYETFKLGDFSREVNNVLSVIFQSLGDSDSMNEEEQISSTQRVHESLYALSQDDNIKRVLHDIAPVLWQQPDTSWHLWARERWKTTFAASLLQACKEVTNQFDDNELIFDIVTTKSEQEEIWITEQTPGGGGVIEEIVSKYQEDPRRFFRLVESALGPSDYELIDSEMSLTLQLIQQEEEMKEAFQKFRQSENYTDSMNAVQQIHTMLHERGVLVSHPVKSAIYNRILRPGSSEKTDELLVELINIWKKEEARLGIDIDARNFAYVFSTNERLYEQYKLALSHIDPTAIQRSNWRYQLIYGLLWPRGNQIRSRALITYHPFTQLAPPDREILLDFILQEKIVSLSDNNWKEHVQNILKKYGLVKIKVPITDEKEGKLAILELAANPLEVGFLSLYPRVEGIERKGNNYYVSLDIREVIQ